MVHLKKIGLGLAAALTLGLCGAHSASAQTLWYNGSFDGRDATPNGMNTLHGSDQVYDNFIVPVGTLWQVNSVFSNNLTTAGFTATQAAWEIRSGVSDGNAGTLVAFGTNAATQTATGLSAFGLTEAAFSADISTVTLDSGMYWLTVAPISDGTELSFLSTTSGAGAIGTPMGNDDQSFFNSAFFGANFMAANQIDPINLPTVDYSLGLGGTSVPLGVKGAAVPEPGSFALLMGMGVTGSVFAASRLRRRRK